MEVSARAPFLIAREASGSPLDWRWRSEAELFETAREGRAVRIHFEGKENVGFDHLSQTAVLPGAGRYALSARMKTEGITTNEGLRLAIPDLGVKSESMTGSNDWVTVRLEFEVREARAVRVAVVREPSVKFDNKIEGTAWVTGFVLEGLRNGRECVRR